MKKGIITALTLAVLAAALSGCKSERPAPAESPAQPIQSEAAQPAPSAAEQSPTPAVPDSGQAENDLIEFESDFGYSISYAEDSFDYRRTEGYDEFILKSDAADKPFVSVCISRIGAEFAASVKEAALGEASEPCSIGQAQTQGQCSQTEETWEGGTIIRKTYVCPLKSGDALLIETQWYTEEPDHPYAALLEEMVGSIKI